MLANTRDLMSTRSLHSGQRTEQGHKMQEQLCQPRTLLTNSCLQLRLVECPILPAPPWLLVRPSCPPCHTCCLAASSRRLHSRAENGKEETVYYGSSLIKFSAPVEEKKPQSMMMLLPCVTDGLVFFW